MRCNYLIRALGIKGFQVAKVEEGEWSGRSTLTLVLQRRSKVFSCEKCGRRVKRAYRYREREVQHLPFWQHLTFLRLGQYRVFCPRCGWTVEKLPFLDRYSRVTTALAALVSELCKVMTNKDVSTLLGLHRHTIKAIDKRAMAKAQAERPLDGITVLGIDEISVGKGQNYWHLVSALEGPRGCELIYVGEGRKEEDLRGFWQWFGPERVGLVTHMVMDLWKAFIRSCRHNCPQAAIIFDKFHIIRHLLEALNTVRKRELRRAGKKFRGLLAGKKFILLSRQAHLRGKAREALRLLLAANRRLFKAHLLKESFNHLWTYRSKTWARKFFRQWVESLKWSRLASYQRFAAMVDKHLDGILAYCDKRVSLGFLEATNLKARNIIRRAYGYRDKAYMKLKIIQACSPLGKFRPWASCNIMP